MVALETGWTPDVLAELPSAFRAGCHWALYARAISGPDGMPSVQIPKGASPEVRLDAQRARAEVMKLRESLYPEGD